VADLEPQLLDAFGHGHLGRPRLPPPRAQVLAVDDKELDRLDVPVDDLHPVLSHQGRRVLVSERLAELLRRLGVAEDRVRRGVAPPPRDHVGVEVDEPVDLEAHAADLRLRLGPRPRPLRRLELEDHVATRPLAVDRVAGGELEDGLGLVERLGVGLAERRVGAADVEGLPRLVALAVEDGPLLLRLVRLVGLDPPPLEDLPRLLLEALDALLADGRLPHAPRRAVAFSSHRVALGQAVRKAREDGLPRRVGWQALEVPVDRVERSGFDLADRPAGHALESRRRLGHGSSTSTPRNALIFRYTLSWKKELVRRGRLFRGSPVAVRGPDVQPGVVAPGGLLQAVDHLGAVLRGGLSSSRASSSFLSTLSSAMVTFRDCSDRAFRTVDGGGPDPD